MVGYDKDNLIRRLIGWWRDRGSELGAIGGEELRRMANDLGLESRELLECAAEDPRCATLMVEMVAALGLDLASLRATDPGVVRIMEITCTRCGSKARCASDLDAGRLSPETLAAYCPNRPTMEALRLM